MPAQVALAPRTPRVEAHAPNAALTADAGALAPAIARVWARPHAAYFQAEPARRRLVGLIAFRAGAQASGLAEAFETWSLKRLVAAFLPEAPAGFVEALRKSADPAWSAQDYRALLDLLSDEAGAKLVRHAPRIDRAFIATVSELPRELRRTRILARLGSPIVAGLVARGAKRACGKQARDLARLADRLERARSTQGLFRMLIDEIGLEQLAPPPVPGAAWFVPLSTASQIENAALRFANCLAYRVPMLLRGRAAYYEVTGEEPAIVEILRDVHGLWIAGEVRGHANNEITPALAARIRGHLEFHGARHRGGAPDQLALALARAAGW